MILIAFMAWIFDTGLELIFHILSNACDIASNEVSIVIFFGKDKVKLLSNNDNFENKLGWINECFLWFFSSQIVAQQVSSLPVPAGVGIEIKSTSVGSIKSCFFSR